MTFREMLGVTWPFLFILAVCFGVVFVFNVDCNDPANKNQVYGACQRNAIKDCYTNTTRPREECQELAKEACLVCRD